MQISIYFLTTISVHNKDSATREPAVKAPAPPPIPSINCPPLPPFKLNGPPLPPTKNDLLPKKNIPQSAQPLKSFNWSKLPDMKVANTIWSELDETKWYNSMDLESIDRMFSAYQKNEKSLPVSKYQVQKIVLTKFNFFFIFRRRIHQ